MRRRLTTNLMQGVFFVLAYVGFPAHAEIQDVGMQAPSDPIARQIEAPTSMGEEDVEPASLLLRGLFYFYQGFVGPTKGTQCPMIPSCSEYARISVAKHGLILGTIMAADRLHRCGHDLHLYPRLWSFSRGWCHDDPLH